MEHMNKNHGLPVWDADPENKQNPGILDSEQAFGGVLKSWHTSGKAWNRFANFHA